MMTDYKKYYFMQPGINSLRRDQHKIMSQANIWAVGVVMWSLLTLDEIETLSNQINSILMGKQRSFDGVNIVKRFKSGITRNYSAGLLELVQRCLRMRIQDRPKVRDLLREISDRRRECLEREAELAQQTGDLQHLSLACTSDELNNLISGDAALDKDDAFWEAFAERLVWVPQESSLPCPPSAPEHLSMDASWPEALRQRLEERWATAVKNRGQKMSAPPAVPIQSQKRTASAAFAEPEALDGHSQTRPGSKRDRR